MTNILHIKSSIRGDESVSSALGSAIIDGMSADGTATVTIRDLASADLPFIDADRFAAHLAPYADRTAKQNELAHTADTLIAEVQAADVIVMSVPIYNFGPPASIKAWADLVARAGTTFEYTASGPQGKLTGKTAYLAFASGGTPVGGDMDFLTPWLKFFLGFLGITDVRHVAADGIMGEGGEAKIEQAKADAGTLAG